MTSLHTLSMRLLLGYVMRYNMTQRRFLCQMSYIFISPDSHTNVINYKLNNCQHRRLAHWKLAQTRNLLSVKPDTQFTFTLAHPADNTDNTNMNYSKWKLFIHKKYRYANLISLSLKMRVRQRGNKHAAGVITVATKWENSLLHFYAETEGRSDWHGGNDQDWFKIAFLFFV